MIFRAIAEIVIGVLYALGTIHQGFFVLRSSEDFYLTMAERAWMEPAEAFIGSHTQQSDSHHSRGGLPRALGGCHPQSGIVCGTGADRRRDLLADRSLHREPDRNDRVRRFGRDAFLACRNPLELCGRCLLTFEGPDVCCTARRFHPSANPVIAPTIG